MASDSLTRNRPQWRRISSALAICYLTTVPVLLGVWWSCHQMSDRMHPKGGARSFLRDMTNWDGVWYVDIVAHGYSYQPENRSNVAFFPAFPMLAGGLRWCWGCSPELSLVIVANLCWAAAFCVIAVYCSTCRADDDARSDLVLLTLGFWPAGLFFRMAYSESLFLLLIALTLMGIRRHWPIWLIAIIVGAATGTRAVGVGLLLPFWYCLWSTASSRVVAGTRLLLLTPLACWGLLAFMMFLKVTTGDPLAFVKTQEHWARRPQPAIVDRAIGLLTLQPIRDVYDSESPAYWSKDAEMPLPFNWAFLNPVFFLVTTSAVIYGASKGWLTREEWLTAAGLLLIPYVFHSHRILMLGHARFASVVLPMYFVLGRSLQMLSPSATSAALGIAAVLLAFSSALFAGWYYVL